MRLIDADRLIDELNRREIEFRADINEIILTTPTADVEPVRQRWIRRKKMSREILERDKETLEAKKAEMHKLTKAIFEYQEIDKLINLIKDEKAVKISSDEMHYTFFGDDAMKIAQALAALKIKAIEEIDLYWPSNKDETTGEK